MNTVNIQIDKYKIKYILFLRINSTHPVNQRTDIVGLHKKTKLTLIDDSSLDMVFDSPRCSCSVECPDIAASHRTSINGVP
jgi:hypothetical protein